MTEQDKTTAQLRMTEIVKLRKEKHTFRAIGALLGLGDNFNNIICFALKLNQERHISERGKNKTL